MHTGVIYVAKYCGPWGLGDMAAGKKMKKRRSGGIRLRRKKNRGKKIGKRRDKTG